MTHEDERAEELRLAHEYAAAAGIHHRRALALRQAGDGERADEQLVTARRFEDRARVKAHGDVMPPYLRTPTEGLRRANDFRVALAGVLEEFADVTIDEWAAFDAAQREPTDHAPAAQRLAQLRELAAGWGVVWPDHDPATVEPRASPLPRVPARFSAIWLPADRM